MGRVLWVTVITMKTLSILTIMVLRGVRGRWIVVRNSGKGISLMVTVITTVTIIKTCTIRKWCIALSVRALVVVVEPGCSILKLLVVSFVSRRGNRTGYSLGG